MTFVSFRIGRHLRLMICLIIDRHLRLMTTAGSTDLSRFLIEGPALDPLETIPQIIASRSSSAARTPRSDPTTARLLTRASS